MAREITTTKGVNMAGSTTRRGGGRLVASVTDPDGNVLGLIQDR